METFLIALTIAVFVCAALTSMLAVYAWQHRATTGATTFFWLLLCVAGWCFARGMRQTSPTIDLSYTWNVITYFFVALLPVAFFMFTMEYTGRNRWLSSVRAGLLLLSIPAATQIIHLVEPALFLQVEFQTVGQFLVKSETAGPWFWVHTIHGYSLIIISIVLLGQRAISGPKLYRDQGRLLLAAALIPLAANIPSTFFLLPPDFPSFTEIGFAITSLIFAWGLFRYQLLDVMPIARDVVMESMDDAVIVLDTQDRVVDINPAGQAIVGQGRDSVVGERAIEVFSQWPALVQTYADIREAQDAILMPLGGTPHHFDLRISPLYRRGDRPAGRLIVLRDITERVRIQQEREQLLQEVDAYAHTVAHDLKNPLGVITGRAQLIQLNPDPEKTVDYADHIVSTGRKMNNIINELLLLATVRKQDQVEHLPLVMEQVIGEALARLENLIDEHTAAITVAEEWPEALGYPAWVEEIWVNYISNAIKYGGQPPHVEIGATAQPDGSVRCWVRDNGRGLTQAEQEQLFVEFARLEQARAEGHGLGLSIVQRIADKLGGEVGVESEIGEGSTFYFTLPGSEGLT